jgi:hypothetical protein
VCPSQPNPHKDRHVASTSWPAVSECLSGDGTRDAGVAAGVHRRHRRATAADTRQLPVAPAGQRLRRRGAARACGAWRVGTLRARARADVPGHRRRAGVLHAGGRRRWHHHQRHVRRGAHGRHWRLPARVLRDDVWLGSRRRAAAVRAVAVAAHRNPRRARALGAVLARDAGLHALLHAGMARLGRVGALHRLDGARRAQLDRGANRAGGDTVQGLHAAVRPHGHGGPQLDERPWLPHVVARAEQPRQQHRRAAAALLHAGPVGSRAADPAAVPRARDRGAPAGVRWLRPVGAGRPTRRHAQDTAHPVPVHARQAGCRRHGLGGRQRRAVHARGRRVDGADHRGLRHRPRLADGRLFFGRHRLGDGGGAGKGGRGVRVVDTQQRHLPGRLRAGPRPSPSSPQLRQRPRRRRRGRAGAAPIASGCLHAPLREPRGCAGCVRVDRLA